MDRADGTTVVFAAQRIERHDKKAFPTDGVYGDTPDSQLRLITCGREIRPESPQLRRQRHRVRHSIWLTWTHPSQPSRNEGWSFRRAASRDAVVAMRPGDSLVAHRKAQRQIPFGADVSTASCKGGSTIYLRFCKSMLYPPYLKRLDGTVCVGPVGSTNG